jgi:hypothetical protein
MEKEYLIKEFEDLLKLLKEKPEYVEKLRVIILTKDLIELPLMYEKDTKEIKQSQKRIEEKLKQHDKDIQELKEGQKGIEEKQNEIKKMLIRLDGRYGDLLGWQFEQKIKENAPAYLGRYIKKCKIKSKTNLVKDVEKAFDENLITDEERLEALSTDLVVEGYLIENNENVYLVCEISYTIEVLDIERVIKRSLILEKVYKKRVIPVLIGKRITAEAKKLVEKMKIIFVEVE